MRIEIEETNVTVFNGTSTHEANEQDFSFEGGRRNEDQSFEIGDYEEDMILDEDLSMQIGDSADDGSIEDMSFQVEDPDAEYASFEEEDEIGRDFDQNADEFIADRFGAEGDHIPEEYSQFMIPLFDTSSFSVGKFCLSMCRIKCSYNIPAVAMDQIYRLIHRILPSPNLAPTSQRAARKVISIKGLDYQSIHACANNCIIYYGVNASLESYPICLLLRYQNHTKSPRKVYTIALIALSFITNSNLYLILTFIYTFCNLLF
jgi:hypothetical protein